LTNGGNEKKGIFPFFYGKIHKNDFENSASTAIVIYLRNFKKVSPLKYNVRINYY
jgi:hypothetical protein